MNGEMNTVSNQQVIKGLIGATVAGIVLAVTVVLPAEYNKDITGIGKALGLTTLNAAVPDEDGEVTGGGNGDFIFAQSTGEFKSDTVTFTLPEYEGVEVKALLKAGNGMSYEWSANGGELYMDMHGEKLGAGDEFESYKKAKAISADSGIFKAPFEGTHGWYWQNMSDEPVEITVKVAGFYSSVKTIN